MRCFLAFFNFPILCPGSGVVFDFIDLMILAFILIDKHSHHNILSLKCLVVSNFQGNNIFDDQL